MLFIFGFGPPLANAVSPLPRCPGVKVDLSSEPSPGHNVLYLYEDVQDVLIFTVHFKCGDAVKTKFLNPLVI